MPAQPLGRRQQFDERSKLYRIAPLLADEPRTAFSVVWPINKLMNQGQTLQLEESAGESWDPSSCTGFSRAHACNAMPWMQSFDEYDAFGLYRDAQRIDIWPDTPPAEGSSVLAAVQAGQALGWLESYWWALTLDELVLSVCYQGPGVAGSWWYDSMFEADHRGFISPNASSKVGGHAWCIGGVVLELGAAVIYQSWGEITNITDIEVRNVLETYGVTSENMRHVQLIDLHELWELLEDDGEYCVSLEHQPADPLPDPEVQEGCSPLKKLRRK